MRRFGFHGRVTTTPDGDVLRIPVLVQVLVEFDQTDGCIRQTMTIRAERDTDQLGEADWNEAVQIFRNGIAATNEASAATGTDFVVFEDV